MLTSNEQAYWEYAALMAYHDRYWLASSEEKDLLTKPDQEQIEQAQGLAASHFSSQFQGKDFHHQLAQELDQAIADWDFIRLRFLGYLISVHGTDDLIANLLSVVHHWTQGLEHSPTRKMLLHYSFILEQFIQLLPYEGALEKIPFLNALLHIPPRDEPPRNLSPCLREALTHIAVVRNQESWAILNHHRKHPFEDIREEVEEWLQDYVDNGLSDGKGIWLG